MVADSSVEARVGASGPILIVDDDPHIREVVRFALGREGYEVCEAGDGAAALAEFERRRPVLVILDILMPEMDGTEVARALRARSGVPIVFLSSKDDEVDRVLGLELGGDDYVTKPFSPRELIARVRAVLRRLDPARRGADDGAHAAESQPARELTHGRLRVDLDRYRAWWDETEVSLTATEFGLLAVLLRFPDKVYSRHELMESAYADESFVSGRTIDSHVRRIRQKFAALGAEPIETALGLGYRLGPCR